jgi:hypothetical protein
MKELDNSDVSGGRKANFKSFCYQINLSKEQRALMYKLMNDGDVDFLKTYVNMLELNAPDSEKLK